MIKTAPSCTAASRFLQCRNELHLRSEYVAELIGVSIDDLNRIESGDITPSSDLVRKLAEVYGWPEHYFYNSETISEVSVKFRNGNQLSDFDQRQILEFLSFQKEISKLKLT